jgi:hypothetical protein
MKRGIFFEDGRSDPASEEKRKKNDALNHAMPSIQKN